MSCGCCRRPRYQRLIDGIFSHDAEGQLNQGNLQQLLYLAKSSPDKLDDIGKYLHSKLRKFVRSNKLHQCHQCLTIVESLMEQSSNRTISLVVKNLLPMLVTLLETSNHELQIMAMDTLLKFKDQPEETPAYQQEYDFIIERLTSLALPTNVSTDVRLKAIDCLSGLVTKVSRDRFYQVMIWEEVHLNKLVPVYLSRMKEEPSEDLMSSFVATAEITHFPRLMCSVFEHFDRNDSWITDSSFVQTIMEIVVKATESRMAHSIVEALLGHLSKQASNVLISTAIVQVLDKVVAMAAESMAGPYLLDFLRKLVSHLKTNISQAHSSSENKATLEKFQHELVKVIISCGECVPNYERWNIVCFLISQMPDQVAVATDIQLSRELMRMCARVMSSIKMKALDDIFSDQVYSSMRILWKYTSAELVPLVLLLWTQAMDWKGNSAKIPLTVSWSSLEEVGLSCVEHKQYIFNSKYLQSFTTSLAEFAPSLQWERAHMEAYYRFLAVIPLSLGVEAGKSLVKVAMEIQDSSCRDSACCHQFCHVVVAGLLHTLSAMLPGKQTWNLHVAQVLERRGSQARHLLPDGFFLGTDMLNITESKESVSPDLLFSSDQLHVQGLPTLIRLPSISVYDTADRSDSAATQSVVLLSPPPGDDPDITFVDIREGQGLTGEGPSSPATKHSFQEALTKEANLVHQQIANLLTSPMLTGDDFGTETIELPEIH